MKGQPAILRKMDPAEAAQERELREILQRAQAQQASMTGTEEEQLRRQGFNIPQRLLPDAKE